MEFSAPMLMAKKIKGWVLALALLTLSLVGLSCDSNDVINCDSTDDCAFGQVCLTSFCAQGAPCEVDSDCGNPDIICVNGACVLEATFESDGTEEEAME